MGTLRDARLGAVELGSDGYGEASLGAGPWRPRLTVEWAGELPAGEVDLVPGDPGALLERALRFATDGGDETVELFLSHHLREFAPEELEAIVGEGAAAGLEGLRAALEPIALHVVAGAGPAELVVDLGFGQGVTEVVLAVRLDPSGRPLEVDAES